MPVSGRPIPFRAALRRDREPRPTGKEPPSHDKSEYASVRIAGFDSEKHHWCTPLPRIRSLTVAGSGRVRPTCSSWGFLPVARLVVPDTLRLFRWRVAPPGMRGGDCRAGRQGLLPRFLDSSAAGVLRLRVSPPAELHGDRNALFRSQSIDFAPCVGTRLPLNEYSEIRVMNVRLRFPIRMPKPGRVSSKWVT